MDSPKKEVPFVCIEPWCTVPARQDIVEDIETQADFISLEADKVYENNWSICVENEKKEVRGDKSPIEAGGYMHKNCFRVLRQFKGKGYAKKRSITNFGWT